jgi:hypothetical protein
MEDSPSYGGSPDGASVISSVLKAAEPRPVSSGTASEKNKYAVRFADAMAECFARDLGAKLTGITASSERSAKSAIKAKQLDVNFSTPATGLALGISLKSVHIREGGGSGRYTHNLKRNEEELRIEALGYHKRQPYAVMVGVLFLPIDACTDGSAISSFASWVRHLRPYAGRIRPEDEPDRFEKLYLGLYETDGSDLTFFDVESDPPKRGVPKATGNLLDDTGRVRRALVYSEWLEAIYRVYLRRNNAEFKWADGDEDPLQPETQD